MAECEKTGLAARVIRVPVRHRKRVLKSRHRFAEREGLLGWSDDWCRDFNADPAACERMVDAMARFLEYLRARGASYRTLASVRSDLNSAGFIVMRNRDPKERVALREFETAPPDFEFRRLITASPASRARFERTCKTFAFYLREAGMLDPGPAPSATRGVGRTRKGKTVAPP